MPAVSPALYSQSESPVFRSYRQSASVQWMPSTIPGIQKQLRDFNLIREANNGDPAAQNDLGLQYLTGSGFKADTAKAAYWITKAAAKDYYSARFNLGLLQLNSFGVEWNPFQAYANIAFAAEQDLPQALYVMGLFYTDNLIVAKNWKTAYIYLQKARMKGHEKAGDVIAELLRNGYISASDTASIAAEDVPLPSPPPLPSGHEEELRISARFLDTNFDTTAAVSTATLLSEAIASGGLDAKDSAALFRWYNGVDSGEPPAQIARLQNLAGTGNPEAAACIGKLTLEGRLGIADHTTALEWYIRALYLDSRRAVSLMNPLLNDQRTLSAIRSKSFENDPSAMTVWAALGMLRIDGTISGKTIAELLDLAVEHKHVPAMILLGIAYSSGDFVGKDDEKAMWYWEQAARNGSMEGETRIAAIQIIQGRRGGEYDSEISLLRVAEQRGSLLAQVALAFCDEEGRGVIQNKAAAESRYRTAAVRGSVNAFRALKSMYDALRPENDPRFRVE